MPTIATAQKAVYTSLVSASKRGKTAQTALRKGSNHQDVVVEWIRRQVAEGALAPGSITSLERIETATHYKPHAIRRAVALLKQEGLLKAQPGLGIQILAADTAASLSAGQSKIALVIPGKQDHLFFSRFKKPIEIWAAKREWSIDTISSTSLNPDRLQSLSGMYGHIVVWTPALSADVVRSLAKLPLSTIMVGPGDDHVTWDRVALGSKAARHLLEMIEYFDHASPHEIFLLAEEDSIGLLAFRSGIESELKQHRIPINILCPKVIPDFARAKEYAPVVVPRNAGRLVGSRLMIELLGPLHALPKRQLAGDGPLFGKRLGIITISWEFTRGVLESLQQYGLGIPQSAFLCAIDESGAPPGSFTTSVQPDPFELGKLVCDRLDSPENSQIRDCHHVTLRRRRSTDCWLHKLWRGFCGNAVTKNSDLRLQSANPAFEHFAQSAIGSLIGLRPTEYWPEEIGRQIQSFDVAVLEGNQCLLTTESFRPIPASSRRTFTFRFPFHVRQASFVGSLGFQIGREDKVQIPPNWSNGEESTDPDDVGLEAFFENLPCSVLIQDPSTLITLYANRAFRSLWPNAPFQDFIGRSEAEYMQGDPTFVDTYNPDDVRKRLHEKVLAEGPVSLKSLGAPNPPMGANGRQRGVLYFYLFDSFFKPVAIASIGWDYGLVERIVKEETAFASVSINDRGFERESSY